MVDSFYRQVIAAIRSQGFEHAENAKGSHQKWVDTAGKTLIVPFNLKSRHTANAILKDAGSDVRL